MGSRLSGRFGHRHGQKTFTSDLPCLDARHFLLGSRMRTGTFCMDVGGGRQVFLDIRPNSMVARASAEVWRRMVQGINIETTGSRASLHRTWLCCPSHSCGRRVIALYFRDGFFCRHCLNLAYPSQNRSKLQRLYGEYNQLDRKLGLFDGDGIRPKGMHHRTYDPLQRRAQSLYRLLFGPVNRAFIRVKDLG